MTARVVVISEIPVAYRTGLFERVREHSALDLRVIYLAAGQQDRPWEPAVADDEWRRTLKSRDLSSSAEGFQARLTSGLGSVLAEWRPDLVLLPGWAHPAAWQAAVWCRRKGVPYAVMFENWKSQHRTWVPDAVTQRLRRWVLDNAAVVLPAGARAAKFAATITGTTARVFHANSCDVQGAEKASAGIERRSSPTVLFVGRLLPHKGIDLLLDLAADLARDGIAVEIAGDGDRRDAVLRSEQQGHCRYLGAVQGDARFEMMARSHLVLVPSLEEPWGVVVHEALASGTPVIASTEVGCVDDLIVAGQTGAIVPPDTGSFAAAVVSWLDSDMDLSNQCRERAETITYAVASGQLEQVVDEVLA